MNILRTMVAAVVTGFLLVALVTGSTRTVVDWRALRAIALESDDWGLAGFVPHADSWAGLNRESLNPGRFPAVYWLSTLEDAAVVNGLVEILSRHRGRDGVAAVLQPNYVMSSMAWDGDVDQWVHYDLPQWPPQYPRPGLWDAVNAGRNLGVWRPEFHATMHYDPEQRRARGVASALAREVTSRGISLFPESEGARELAPWRSEAHPGQAGAAKSRVDCRQNGAGAEIPGSPVVATGSPGPDISGA